MPIKSKERLWDMLEYTFDIPEEARDWVYKAAGVCWRGHKSRLKKQFFRDGMSTAEIEKTKPKIIPLSQWKKLVKYWCDPKTKVLAERNKKSVQQRKNVHNAGSCSFARIAASEAKKGKEPSLAAVYIKTRTRRDGASQIDDKTKDELLKLGDDDKVEEYLVANNLIKKRPGTATLKGRRVGKSALKRAKYEEKVKKKSRKEIKRIRAQHTASVEELRDEFTIIIQNLIAKFQTNNHLGSDFENFNAYEGCPGFDTSPDYVPES